jgi:hypothetical protein
MAKAILLVVATLFVVIVSFSYNIISVNILTIGHGRTS